MSARRRRTIIAVECDECRTAWSDYDPVPWSLSSTAAMHERGTGHKVRRIYADD